MDIQSLLATTAVVGVVIASGTAILLKSRKRPSPTRRDVPDTHEPYGREARRRSAISVEGPGSATKPRHPSGAPSKTRASPVTELGRVPAPPYEKGPNAHRDRIALVGFHERGFIMMRPALLDAEWIPERFRLLNAKIDGVGTNITDGLRKAIDLACTTPRGRRRRIVLLSDGEANREKDRLFQQVARAERNYINIDCIAFGPDAPRDLLSQVSDGTHNGRMIAVGSLRELSDALTRSAATRADASRTVKPETTIYCIDASLSMRMQMPHEAGHTRIEVVEECLFRLLACKQHTFA